MALEHFSQRTAAVGCSRGRERGYPKEERHSWCCIVGKNTAGEKSVARVMIDIRLGYHRRGKVDESAASSTVLFFHRNEATKKHTHTNIISWSACHIRKNDRKLSVSTLK